MPTNAEGPNHLLLRSLAHENIRVQIDTRIRDAIINALVPNATTQTLQDLIDVLEESEQFAGLALLFTDPERRSALAHLEPSTKEIADLAKQRINVALTQIQELLDLRDS